MPKQPPPPQGTKEPTTNNTAEVFKEEQPTESQDTPNPFKTPSKMGIDVIEV